MLRNRSPGFIIEGIRVGLNFLDITVRIQRPLRDLEVLHELQGDSICWGIQAVWSPVMNCELNSKDGLDAVADNLQLASIYCYHDPYISLPHPVVILSITPAGKGASRLLFVPTDARCLECGLNLICFAVWKWPTG